MKKSKSGVSSFKAATNILFILNEFKNYIRSIPDYPKGILFRDITTLIKDEKAFAAVIDQIVSKSKKFNFDKIAAIGQEVLCLLLLFLIF